MNNGNTNVITMWPIWVATVIAQAKLWPKIFATSNLSPLLTLSGILAPDIVAAWMLNFRCRSYRRLSLISHPGWDGMCRLLQGSMGNAGQQELHISITSFLTQKIHAVRSLIQPGAKLTKFPICIVIDT